MYWVVARQGDESDYQAQIALNKQTNVLSLIDTQRQFSSSRGGLVGVYAAILNAVSESVALLALLLLPACSQLTCLRDHVRASSCSTLPASTPSTRTTRSCPPRR